MIACLIYAKRTGVSGKNSVFDSMILTQDYAGELLKQWLNSCNACGSRVRKIKGCLWGIGRLGREEALGKIEKEANS